MHCLKLVRVLNFGSVFVSVSDFVAVWVSLSASDMVEVRKRDVNQTESGSLCNVSLNQEWHSVIGTL